MVDGDDGSMRLRSKLYPKNKEKLIAPARQPRNGDTPLWEPGDTASRSKRAGGGTLDGGSTDRGPSERNPTVEKTCRAGELTNNNRAMSRIAEGTW